MVDRCIRLFLKDKTMAQLEYKCWNCGRITVMHLHSDTHERKQLFCSLDGAELECRFVTDLGDNNANSETSGT